MYYTRNKIENLFNNILNNKSIYIKNDSRKYIDIKDIKVGEKYIIFNKDISFKITVEEKIDEW
ncbi:hypothetical protein ABGF35_00115 [Helcococcus ovis]|uniref:hypothetical protein n=1 Tax=Helcococcus ovis TaxID=72026 RepID=UPI0038BA9067